MPSRNLAFFNGSNKEKSSEPPGDQFDKFNYLFMNSLSGEENVKIVSLKWNDLILLLYLHFPNLFVPIVPWALDVDGFIY